MAEVPKEIKTLNGLRWQKGIIRQRKYNICSTAKKITIYGYEVWRLTETAKIRIMSTAMDVLRRSARVSRNARFRNTTDK